MTGTAKSKSIESPLGRAKGMGSTHHGVEHWLLERVTAVVSLLLMVWLVWSVAHISMLDYASFTAWVAQPVNAVLLILAIMANFIHAAMGIQVVLDDYVHCHALKLVSVTGVKLVFFAAAVACIFSILKIAFAG